MNKIIKIILTALILITLSGCMKMDINMKVNKDGTCLTKGSIVFDEELMEKMDISNDDVFLEFKNSGYDFKKNEYEEIEFEEDGIKYKGISFNYQEEKLIDFSFDKVKHEATLTIDGFKDVNFINFDPNVYNDDELSDIDLLKALGTSAKLIIEMPGRVKETNIGKIVDYNTVEIDLLGNFEEIIVVSYINMFGTLMLVGILVLLLIIALVGLYVRKNKLNLKDLKFSFINNIKKDNN